jgi:hypothetical protein
VLSDFAMSPRVAGGFPIFRPASGPAMYSQQISGGS